MFLSIIIPVHNTEKYIRDCLDSCLSQDIDKSDYEIICVDDGSTDNSVEILRGYEKRETNIHVALLPENKGVSAARNAGIERIQGEYCMFLDSDDYLEDNCFLRLKQMLPEADKKTILCVGMFHFVEKGHANRNENRKEGSYFGCPTQRYITNRLMPSKLVGQLRFQENIAYGEDEVFCLELEQFEPTILKLDEPIYYYRRHCGSAMTLTPEKEYVRYQSVMNSAIYITNKYGYTSERIRVFLRERYKIMCNYILKQKPAQGKKLRQELIRNRLLYPSMHSRFCYPISFNFFKNCISNCFHGMCRAIKHIV